MVDDDEEELRVGSERVPTRVQRPLMVVLVALLGLGGAYLATRGNDDSTPQAEASPTTAVSSFVQSSTPRGAGSPVPASSAPFPATRAPICPTVARCVTSGGVPAAVVRALRAAYPGARVGAVSTLTATSTDGATLLRRTIEATAGPRHVSIVITPFVLGPDNVDRVNDATTSTVMIESTGSGKSVQLLLTEPRAARPDDLTVLRLARDPRLAALR